MDNTYYTTEHRKGQHLFSEERHEIEVRLKDGWSIYKIAKHLQRPYNTIYSPDEICFFADCINGLPRKILGYSSPEELFEMQLDAIYAA